MSHEKEKVFYRLNLLIKQLKMIIYTIKFWLMKRLSVTFTIAIDMFLGKR